MALSNEQIEIGPLFVNELYSDSKISEAGFSFALNGLDDNLSHIDFGQPIESRIEGGSVTSLVEIYFYMDYFWSTEWQAVSFKGNDKGYNTNNTYTIFDTGSANLFIPSSVYDIFHSELLDSAGNPDFVVDSGLTFIECSSVEKFKPISFMFSSIWLTIEPKDYIWDVAGDGRNCVLLIMKNDYDFLIMGLPIF